jgi:uncharacterized protein (TIGR02246 family)
MNAELEKQKIQQVIEAWLQASQRGDTATVLQLMAEDVVFLLPGQEPMRGRSGFAAAAQSSGKKFRLVDSTPRIQEIFLSGDYAFCWNHLDLKMADQADGTMHRRAGDVLSVFRKEPDGRWVIFRDANLLTPQKNPPEVPRARPGNK